MNLNDQATQPSQREYRICACGKRFVIRPDKWSDQKWCSAKCAPPKRTEIPVTEEMLRGGFRLIPLTKGKAVAVDAADYEWLSQWIWYAQPNLTGAITTHYAVRDVWDGATRKKEHILMHRAIMNAADDVLVDHRDGDGLNCRRYNMRIATRAQNNQNARSRANAHGVKGVCYDRDRNLWRAKIETAGKSIHLGRFGTKEEAGEAYRLGAIKYFGEFACSESIVGGDTIRIESENV